MKHKQPLNLLAIETSCDETAAAILRIEKFGDKNTFPQVTTVASVIKSQIKLHSKFGGVVPEAAARAHVQNILPVVKKTINDSQLSLHDLNYIAVTQGPGLIPSLIVGVEFAKMLGLALHKPVIPVNHMAGHLYSPLAGVQDRKLIAEDMFPLVSLIVSGGHTMLIVMRNFYEYTVVGQTVDDAAGEAFDKVAKLLELPYPGGPQVSKLAVSGHPDFQFPRPMMNSKDYNFSFSGLKTAVLYFLRDHPLLLNSPSLKANICAAFEDAVVDVLVTKTLRAVKQYKAKSVSLSGGVSANQKLRTTMETLCAKQQLVCLVPPLHLTTDNGEMVGLAAVLQLSKSQKSFPLVKIQANPNLQL